MSKPLTMKGPCVVCGATDYAESCGGPTICPMCDCGVQPTWVEVRALRASLAAAEAKLTAASKAAIDMMNRHRDVVLSLEAKLADYEGTDGRCPAGHNKRFTYDLSDLGGKVGCVACERDELAAKLADAEKHADELADGLRDTLAAARWPLNHTALVKWFARRSARDGQEGTR